LARVALQAAPGLQLEPRLGESRLGLRDLAMKALTIAGQVVLFVPIVLVTTVMWALGFDESADALYLWWWNL
jgi:hypothetical protein